MITVDVIKIEVSLVVSRRDVDSVGLSLGNAFGSSCQEDKAVDHVVGVQEFALNHFQHLLIIIISISLKLSIFSFLFNN